jgi:hypothetical protein
MVRYTNEEGAERSDGGTSVRATSLRKVPVYRTDAMTAYSTMLAMAVRVCGCRCKSPGVVFQVVRLVAQLKKEKRMQPLSECHLLLLSIEKITLFVDPQGICSAAAARRDHLTPWSTCPEMQAPMVASCRQLYPHTGHSVIMRIAANQRTWY